MRRVPPFYQSRMRWACAPVLPAPVRERGAGRPGTRPAAASPAPASPARPARSRRRRPSAGGPPAPMSAADHAGLGRRAQQDRDRLVQPAARVGHELRRLVRGERQGRHHALLRRHEVDQGLDPAPQRRPAAGSSAAKARARSAAAPPPAGRPPRTAPRGSGSGGRACRCRPRRVRATASSPVSVPPSLNTAFAASSTRSRFRTASARAAARAVRRVWSSASRASSIKTEASSALSLQAEIPSAYVATAARREPMALPAFPAAPPDYPGITPLGGSA